MKIEVGIIGATGMVGQRFITLLHNHPWFHINVLAASPRSAGMKFEDAVKGRWIMKEEIPACVKDMLVVDGSQIETIANRAQLVFCAVDMPKAEVRALEETYAKTGVYVVSNNSACRGLDDVPMLIPEINGNHIEAIAAQRKRLGTDKGFIVVKPNCSIQSYVPVLTPLLPFGLEKISVCTYQAISGAGKTFDTLPEILDNVIPFISGEEEKSEQEPLKIWGKVEDGHIVSAQKPLISAQCLRVPVSDGHMAAFSVSFKNKPTKEQMLDAWNSYVTEPQLLELPHAPKPFVRYMEDAFRPQTRLDRDWEGGMGVSVGRLRDDILFDYRMVGLSHNTLRGAAGGGVLSAEYLLAKGYIK